MLTVINANMANAIRSRTVQKGIDPRDYALVAFGGAGPAARRRGGRHAGHSRGDRAAASRHHLGDRPARPRDLHYDAIRTAFQVRARARPRAHQRATSPPWRRSSPSAVHRRRHRRSRTSRFERRGDLRYVGQGYELQVPIPDGHDRRQGAGQGVRDLPRAPSPRVRPPLRRARIEIVNMRLTGVGRCRQDRQARRRRGNSLDAARVKTGTLHVPRRRQARRAIDDRLLSRATCCRSARHRRSRHHPAERLAPPSCRPAAQRRGRRRRQPDHPRSEAQP